MNASYVLQIVAFVPLMYMCICTYYSLFKVGMLMFYSLTPRQTSSVSLLMICAMVARYAPPISYNFLNLICLDGNSKTTFELRMGNIDDAVPFFGKGFNKIYPLIMVVYTLLIASNFFGRLIDYLGSWKKFKIQNEEQDVDGLDPSGVIILQKERSWLEQGHTVGELVIPLARNFYNSNMDVESDGLPLDRDLVNKSAGITKKNGKESHSKGMKEETNPYDIKREPVAKKYAALKDEQGSQRTGSKENGTKDSQSLLAEVDSQQQFSGTLIDPPVRGIDSTWASMKSGLQSFRANIVAKKFLPLRQVQESSLHVRESSSESLDDIFQRLKKRPNSERTDELDLDD